jgi:GntR family transcriptional repressor for pyruvate dehydrogenase complex
VFEPIRSRRTFEEAVEQIADAIRTGDLALGARLPAERTLAEMMEISRPTLREALALLAHAGVVEVRPGVRGGTFVKSELVPADLIRDRSRMRISEVAAVLEARRAFEPRVAQLAGLHGSEEHFASMQRTIELQRKTMRSKDHDVFLQLDTRFHLTIAKATRNPTIVSMMKVLFRQLEIARDMAPRSLTESQRAIELHEMTYQAILGGDAEAIDAAMDEHLSWLESFWEEETGRPRLRTTPDFLLPRAARASQADGKAKRSRAESDGTAGEKASVAGLAAGGSAQAAKTSKPRKPRSRTRS